MIEAITIDVLRSGKTKLVSGVDVPADEQRAEFGKRKLPDDVERSHMIVTGRTSWLVRRNTAPAEKPSPAK